MKDPKQLRIVFFGTPEFAALQMDYLISQNYSIVAAVTAPDKAAGRGRKLSQSAVKQTASAHQIPVLQPSNLKDLAFINELQELNADLFIVVAFRMLPEVVWKLPPRGTFNLHASLLPQYRGAAPINWAIINGEHQSGLTTFFINENIDTGNILLQKAMDIGPNETAGTLHDRMIDEGKILLEQTIQGIALNTINPQQQEIKEKLAPAPKIYRQDCIIDWSQSGKTIHNQIRGLSPYPGAFTQIIYEETQKTSELKILEGEFIEADLQEEKILRLLTDNKTYLKVALRDGFYSILKLQAPGKKAMAITEFLRGNRFEGNWSIQ